MSDRSLTLTASLLLASLSIACGEKGDGTVDETGGSAGSGGTFSSGGSLPASGGTSSSGGTTGGSGGSGDSMALFSFDATDEGIKFEVYTPDDPMYTNVGENSTLAWDEGEGSDGLPGRLRLELMFDAYSQLADIQFNYDGMMPANWAGKTLRAKVMVESGFSPDESAPGGTYLFAKTTASYVWGKGMDQNLLPSAFGNWVTLSFPLDTPAQQNAGFDATQILSFGIQFYTGDPTVTDLAAPTTAIVYVDSFTIQ